MLPEKKILRFLERTVRLTSNNPTIQLQHFIGFSHALSRGQIKYNMKVSLLLFQFSKQNKNKNTRVTHLALFIQLGQ